MHYLSDPDQIYQKSFAIVRAEADLTGFGSDEQTLVIRLIHACGMTDITNDLVISPGAVDFGRAAIKSGAPIICDVNMVLNGIIARNLTHDNSLLCGLDQTERKRHSERKITRTALGIERLADRFSGAVIAIGNAPTALFRLLELLENGADRPAIILGFPVGFVGAPESKAALIASAFGVPFIALSGRRGGSALAAAAVNALAAGLTT